MVMAVIMGLAVDDQHVLNHELTVYAFENKGGNCSWY